MTTLTLTLPRLHPAQAAIDRQAMRFNVLCCGRRFGKDIWQFHRHVRPLLAGRPTAWFSPTYKMLAETWRSAVHLLGPVVARQNAAEHRLELITGGVFEMWSLDSPDVARGRRYAHLNVNEAAMVPNLVDTWHLVLRPTLADYAGSADFGSTPRGYNDFHLLYQQGQAADKPEWASFHHPTADNPFIPPAEIAAMRADMTALQYSQEVLAEFVNLDGGLFKREWFPELDARPADVTAWVRFWDLAVSTKQGADYTVGALVGLRAGGGLVVADVVRGRWEWPDARRVIARTAALDPPGTVIGVEQVAFQLAGIQELLRDPALLGQVIRPVVPDKDKYARALPWASRAEAGTVAVVRGPWLLAWYAELSDFPQGQHDDQVDAVSGAVGLLGRAVLHDYGEESLY